MLFVLALVTGCLFAGATYLLLRRSVLPMLLGIALLGYAGVLLFFSTGITGRTDISTDTAFVQALSIVALVALFGLLLCGLALVLRLSRMAHNDDPDDMTTSDGA